MAGVTCAAAWKDSRLLLCFICLPAELTGIQKHVCDCRSDAFAAPR